MPIAILLQMTPHIPSNFLPWIMTFRYVIYITWRELAPGQPADTTVRLGKNVPDTIA